MVLGFAGAKRPPKSERAVDSGAAAATAACGAAAPEPKSQFGWEAGDGAAVGGLAGEMMVRTPGPCAGGVAYCCSGLWPRTRRDRASGDAVDGGSAQSLPFGRSGPGKAVLGGRTMEPPVRWLREG